MEASNHRFQVQVLQQRWCRPRFDEMQTLHLAPRSEALVREVLLYGNGKPWVYARSVLPAKSIAGPLRYLKRLGTKPLGALLFTHRNMQRSAIELACLQASQIPSQALAEYKEDMVWGRRSVFYLSQQPLLVSELFLPDFVAHLQSQKKHQR